MPTVQTEHPHIVRDPHILGGEPIVGGQRVAVRHLVMAYLQGETVAELRTSFDLTEAQVHDALSYYYPGSCLVTGRDIITLWVARMVIAGLYNLGDLPFTDCFIHANILDGNGDSEASNIRAQAASLTARDRIGENDNPLEINVDRLELALIAGFGPVVHKYVLEVLART